MTPQPTTRRTVLALGTAGALGVVLDPTRAVATPLPTDHERDHADGPSVGDGRSSRRLDRAIARLEATSGRTVGVVAGDGRRARYAYRGAERFPMCSLFKTLLVGALLRDHGYDDAFWQRRIRFTSSQVVVNSPVCSTDPDRDMTVDELADAALRRSDNTAGNLLLELLGGPAAITRFAAGLGATRTRLDRWEPELNEARPGDLRDTSTAEDIHRLFGTLLVGDGLNRLGQARLREWMLRNTTAGDRLRRALPPGGELADKTGAGGYGVVNDAGVFWDGGRHLTVAVMTRGDAADDANDNTVVAEVGRLLIRALLP